MKSESRPRASQRRTMEEPGRPGNRIEAGNRPVSGTVCGPKRKRPGFGKGHHCAAEQRSSGESKLVASAGSPRVSSGESAFRRRGDSTKRRCRRPCEHGQHAFISDRPDRQTSNLYQRSPDERKFCAGRSTGGVNGLESSRASIPRKCRTHRQCPGSRQPHHACRSCCAESRRRIVSG
jgi:hypothetical protein